MNEAEKRTERVAAMVDAQTLAGIERMRVQIHQVTGIMPTVSTMTAKLIADGLRIAQRKHTNG